MQQNKVEIVFRQSTRVTLRPLLETDYLILMKWINDPEVHQYLNSYLPMMEGDQKDWIEKVRSQKPGNIVVMIMADGKPIGTMGIHQIDHRQGTAVTGALIGEKEYWGKGYGSEAKMLLLEYAFNTLNLRKICSDVIAFNDRSYKYSLKCGYKEEGRRKAQYFAKGKYVDQVWLAVFRTDWEPLWKVFVEEHGESLRV